MDSKIVHLIFVYILFICSAYVYKCECGHGCSRAIVSYVEVRGQVSGIGPLPSHHVGQENQSY